MDPEATAHRGLDAANSTAAATRVPTELRAALCRFAYPPLILVGAACNLAALATFQQRRLRRSPVSLGLSALAVLDTLVLLLSAGRFWSKYQLGFDWHLQSQAVCRVSIFLEYWAADCSVWTLLLVTAQRYAGTRMPLRAAKLCSRGRTRPLLLAAAGLCAVKNLPLLLRAQVRANPLSGPLCQIVYDHRLWLAFAWADAAFRFLLPWPSLALLNLIIWRAVRAAGRFRRTSHLPQQASLVEAPSSSLHSIAAAAASSVRLRNQPSQQPQQPQLDDSRRMLSMLVAVNLLFLICQTPFCAFSLVDSVFDLFRKAVQAGDVASYVTLATSFQVALTFVYASHAANFFLYFLSGRLFRRTLLQMLQRSRCRSRCRRSRPNFY